MSSARTALCLALLPLLLATGCGPVAGPVFKETDEPDYQRGKRLLREGNPRQALLSFLRLIDNRPDAAESHLEAGVIYLQQLNPPRPVFAIYHLTRFLEMRPDSRQAEYVEGLIESAKKEFARSLPGRPFDGAMEELEKLESVDKLQKEITRLKAENNRLRREIQELGAASPAEASTGSEAAGEEPPESQPTPTGFDPDNRTYRVQPGDTLSSVSRAVYGDAARWNERPTAISSNARTICGKARFCASPEARYARPADQHRELPKL